MNIWGDNKPSGIASGMFGDYKPSEIASRVLGDNNPKEVILRSIGTSFKENSQSCIKEINKPFTDMYLRHLSNKVKEQDEAYENYISKGYAYSTYYHLITRIVKRHDDSDDYVHALIESELFNFVLTKLQKVEDSKYVVEIFENINRKNLTHYIPFFTLLIERLMRILTETMDANITLRKIKEPIENSLNKYEVVHKKSENSSEEEEREIEILEREISDNAKNLYKITYEQIIQKDFMKSENGILKGNILNRHVLLHGKQDFDKMDNDDAIKLVFLILFFLDLIDLKNKGELVLR